ncbi:MAG: hypothetical protein HZB09_01140, partial [Candidatus Yonathbacteria bacterium]|nr:hypothetical protein [Candidatus Yonathbacteria bacterium]
MYIQEYNATPVALKNTSIGVSPPCLLRGRILRRYSTRLSSSAVPSFVLPKSVTPLRRSVAFLILAFDWRDTNVSSS